MLGISGPELVVIALVAVIIIGPTRLPEYTRTLIDWIKGLRRFVDSSKETMEKDMGVSMDELRKYDPRQYDPRRIVREAWDDTTDGLLPDAKDLLPAAAGGAAAGARSKRSSAPSGSGSKTPATSRKKKTPVDDSTPFDDEAT